MRGEVTRDARPDRARHALIAVQVGASALLLICAAIFLRSAFAAATVDPGVRTSDTLMVSILNETRRAALLQAVTADPAVAAVAASSPSDACRCRDARCRRDDGGRSADTSSRLPIGQIAVSPEYFDVLDIDVVSGRGFTQTERTAEAGVAIVSETVARRLWPTRQRRRAGGATPASEVGSPAHRRSRPPKRARSRACVHGRRRRARCERSARLRHVPFVAVYLPTDPESPGTSLMLRVRGDLEQTRQALLERLTSVDPGLGQINSMRTMAGMQTYILRIAFWVAVVLGGLALVLTVSGLFSVLSYIVEQRAKDIGVRMALGATTRNVAGLVLSQSLRPVGIGLGRRRRAGRGAGDRVDGDANGRGDRKPRSCLRSRRRTSRACWSSSASCVVAASVPALRAARIDPIATLRKDWRPVLARLATSFVAQRRRRIGAGRGPGGHHARRERHAEHEQRGAAEPDRIGGAHAEQDARQNARHGARRRDADHRADDDRAHGLAKDQAEHVSARSPPTPGECRSPDSARRPRTTRRRRCRPTPAPAPARPIPPKRLVTVPEIPRDHPSVASSGSTVTSERRVDALSRRRGCPRPSSRRRCGP